MSGLSYNQGALRHSRRAPFRRAKKPSAGVSRPQARNTVQSFFPRRVRGKNPLARSERRIVCRRQTTEAKSEANPPQKSGYAAFLTRRRGAAKSLRCVSSCRYGHFPCPRICPGGGSGEYPRSGRQRPKTGRNARNWSTVRLFIPDPPRSFSAWRRERSWVLFENGQYAQRRRII